MSVGACTGAVVLRHTVANIASIALFKALGDERFALIDYGQLLRFDHVRPIRKHAMFNAELASNPR
jgi:RimJ/RimL family protein N-acetyltransferase